MDAFVNILISLGEQLRHLGGLYVEQYETSSLRGALILIGTALLVSLPAALLMGRGFNPNTGAKRGYIKRFLRTVPVFLLIAFALFLQIGVIKTERKFKLREDTLFLPDSKYVSLASVGFHEVFASFLFLRSIQAYGGGWQFTGKGGRPKLFEHYYNVITDLKPDFTRAYTFGNMMIGEEMRAPAPALGLMSKGKFLNPQSYRVAYEGAFFSTDRLKDFERGAHYLRWAIQAPDVPSWVERQIYHFKIKSGHFEYGFERYLRLLVNSRRTNNHIEENIARGKIIETSQNWAIEIIDKAVNKYRDERGLPPTTSTELEEGGYIDPYRLPNSQALERVDEFGETVFDQLDKMGMDVDEQVEFLLNQVYFESPSPAERARGVASARIPPSHHRLGWNYEVVGKGFKISARTKDNNFASAYLELYRNVANSLMLNLCMRPAGVAELIDFNYEMMKQQRADPDRVPRSVPDPAGTFILYNPQTGSVNYLSDFWDPQYNYDPSRSAN
jgi:hypothetical protein